MHPQTHPGFPAGDSDRRGELVIGVVYAVVTVDCARTVVLLTFMVSPNRDGVSGSGSIEPGANGV
jgi:hypothetical protein